MSRPDRTGDRRRGRECAVQVLYQLDVTGFAMAAETALDLYFASDFEPERGRPTQDAVEFAHQLVTGTAAQLTALDAAITKAAQHWRVERMARVDRNILRLAAWELLFGADAPPRVVLNEAIELAKQFGTEESGAFVNGILDRIAQDVRR